MNVPTVDCIILGQITMEAYVIQVVKKVAEQDPEKEEHESESRPLDEFPVHIQLFGKHGEIETDSGIRPLLYNKEGKPPFQPGQVR